jgi:ornithine carbamoyltransferase
VVYTSPWPPEERESAPEQLRKLLHPYQITEEIMREAAPNALFMHSQPLHRGEEVEEPVMETFGSTVFHQAENMLHIQKAIMVLWLVDKCDDE